MSKTVFYKVSTLGANAGPFTIYWTDGSSIPDPNKVLMTDVPPHLLLQGITFQNLDDSVSGILAVSGGVCTDITGIFVTPTPTPSITPSISVSPSITPTITPSISVSPSVTPSIGISVTPSISVSPSVTPSISVSPSVTPSISVSPSVTPTPTPSITVTPTPSPTYHNVNIYAEVEDNGAYGPGFPILSSGAVQVETSTNGTTWTGLGAAFNTTGCSLRGTVSVLQGATLYVRVVAGVDSPVNFGPWWGSSSCPGAGTNDNCQTNQVINAPTDLSISVNEVGGAVTAAGC